jgi:hypothetical protein
MHRETLFRVARIVGVAGLSNALFPSCRAALFTAVSAARLAAAVLEDLPTLLACALLGEQGVNRTV